MTAQVSSCDICGKPAAPGSLTVAEGALRCARCTRRFLKRTSRLKLARQRLDKLVDNRDAAEAIASEIEQGLS